MLDSLKVISIVAIVGLGLELVTLPIYLTRLAVDVEGGARTLEVMVSEFNGMLILRLVLSFLGAGLLSAFIYRISSKVGKERLIGNLTYIAFALVLIGEILGRMIFYLSNVRVGV